jgi:hypothetical protein
MILYFYLCQGGYVFTPVCLSVCLSVCPATRFCGQTQKSFVGTCLLHTVFKVYCARKYCLCSRCPRSITLRGTVKVIDDERYVVSGEVSVIGDKMLEITKLPIRVWTQTYKERVLEPMVRGTSKMPAFIT